jgi:POT family proton-dependent oligopeptide transporter
VAVERRAGPQYPYAVKPRQRLIVGYPAGLLKLLLTWMLERFSFFGMGATVLLFLMEPAGADGLGLDLTTAAAAVTAYGVVAYVLAVPGGWVADRITGARRAVLVGAVVAAIGYILLVIPAALTVYVGLIPVAVGTGLLTPNISTMVGEFFDQLPDPHHSHRNSGFSFVYLGINLGAAGGVLMTVWLAQRYGWHAGFAAAAIAMTAAVILYVATARTLGEVGHRAHRPLDEYRRGPTLRRAATLTVICLAGFIAAAALTAQSTERSVLDCVLLLIPLVVIAAAALVVATMLREYTLTPTERSRVRAYVPIFLAATLFWMIYDQVGHVTRNSAGHGSLSLWAVVVLAPLFVVAWARLGDRAPATPVTLAMGLFGIGGSFVLMGFASAVTPSGRISALWLVAIYLVQALAALFLVPVGLAVTTVLAPARFASQTMGLWFLGIATGVAIGEYVRRLSGTVPNSVYYGLFTALAAFGGLALLLAAPRIRRLMVGVQ